MSQTTSPETLVNPLLTAMSDYMSKNDYAKAAEMALLAHRLSPNNSSVTTSLAAIYVRQENWVEAIKFGLLTLALDPNDYNACDALAHAFGGTRQWGEAAKYGRKALEIREANDRKRHPHLPKLAPKPDLSGKKIISFSLFGNSSAYIEPAVMNVQLLEDIYPDWIARFYIDETVPQEAVERLTSPQTEIVYVTAEMKQLPATMWRFLALDDPEASYVIFRDADSVISRREATTVAEWLASGQRFHTIRDSGSHTELILAGLWGAMAGTVPNISQMMYDYVKQGNLHPTFADQFFLRDHVWQYVKQDLYASDRLFGFMNAHPITEVGFDFDITHIGCDEGAMMFHTGDLTSEYPDGQEVYWSLYSTISPLPNDDLSPRYIPERLVCRYKAIVRDRHVSGNIPRRYGRGFNDGSSRILIDKVD